MAATSTDVARHAGVSRSTVSYILNGRADRFSPETRELVERAVAELNYQPQAAGRTLARGHSDIVILVTPFAANTEFQPMVDELTARFYAKGLSLLMRSASAAIDSFTSVIGAVRPLSVISLAALSKAEEKALKAADVRYYDLAKSTSRPGGINRQIGAHQVEHLIARGFTQIRFVRVEGQDGNVLQSARELGVRERCEQIGVSLGETLTVDSRDDMDPAILATLPTGTGLACYNDDVASGVLAAAQEINRPAPRELGIIGSDNSAIARRTTPRLTTVATDFEFYNDLLVDAVVKNRRLPTSTPATEIFVIQGGTT
jgi:DNA-binding LacI/PurR family transcriptional regulator